MPPRQAGHGSLRGLPSDGRILGSPRAYLIRMLISLVLYFPMLRPPFLLASIPLLHSRRRLRSLLSTMYTRFSSPTASIKSCSSTKCSFFRSVSGTSRPGNFELRGLDSPVRVVFKFPVRAGERYTGQEWMKLVCDTVSDVVVWMRIGFFVALDLTPTPGLPFSTGEYAY